MIATTLLAFAPRLFLGLRAIKGSLSTLLHRQSAKRNIVAGERPDALRILIVDEDCPDPTRNAGARAISHVAELLVEEGCRVALWAASSAPSTAGQAHLARLGIEFDHRRPGADLAAWLRRRASRGRMPFDAIVVSRPHLAATYARDARRFGADRCVYYGHDIHHLRLRAQDEFVTMPFQAWSVACMTRIERWVWRRYDAVLYPSDEEAAVVNHYRSRVGLAPNGWQMPLWSVPRWSGPPPTPEGRRGMVFVGSHAHAPNLDGLDWFFENVLPDLRARGLRDPVYVAGNGMERYAPPTPDALAEITGWVDDACLDALYARARIAFVPLRFGAGVKGKVLEAMARGVPCAVTTVAMQGLSGAGDALAPADTPARFADAVVALLEDDDLWQRKSAAGLAYLHDACDRAELKRRLVDVVVGGSPADARARGFQARP